MATRTVAHWGQWWHCAVSLAAFGYLTADVRNNGLISRLDSRMMRSVRADRWVRPARVVTGIGAPELLFPVVLSLCAVRGRRVGLPWSQRYAQVGVLLLACVLRRLICDLVQRPRPPASGWRIQPSGFSYPSKHTATAAVGLTCLVGMLPPGPLRRGVAPAAVATIAAVGASRLVLGVHWPSDVLGAFLFADAVVNLMSRAQCGPRSKPLL